MKKDVKMMIVAFTLISGGIFTATKLVASVSQLLGHSSTLSSIELYALIAIMCGLGANRMAINQEKEERKKNLNDFRKAITKEFEDKINSKISMISEKIDYTNKKVAENQLTTTKSIDKLTESIDALIKHLLGSK